MMEQITLKIMPVAAGICRDLVLLGMLIYIWKIIMVKMPDLYDKFLFTAVGVVLLVTGNLMDIKAVVRFPVLGAGIAAYCAYRKRSGMPKAVFFLLLLYNIHALSYLIAVCFYDFLNMIAEAHTRMEVTDPRFMELLYARLAMTQFLLMAVYVLLAVICMLMLKKIAAGSFEMGMRDLCFLSVLNAVGIIFTYMIIGISFVKLENEVFMLFDERRDALWKVPLTAALLLAGELSSIYVWQKYRALMEEKENVLVYENKLKRVKERLDEADSFYGNIRALKHDIRNHISNIRNLNAKGEHESSEDYIAKIDRALDELDYKFSTGNTVCDVIVNDKYRVCVREHIRFSSDFEFYEQTGVASFDMGIILGNLLDNAIEACQKVEEEERFIELRSKIRGSFVLVEISNSYTGEIVFDDRDGLPVSSKPSREATVAGMRANAESSTLKTRLSAETSKLPESAGKLHGIGLRSSRQVAEKYLGDLKIEKTADTFTVIVMLQMERPVDTL